MTNAFCEPLENRTLLSLTIEVRNDDGSASAVVTSIGQVLNLQVIAVVSSVDNQPREDALQKVTGSFISTGFTSQSVGGDLSASNLNSFNAPGTATGVQQDLNRDGNLDVGETNPADRSQNFVAISSNQPLSAGVVVGNTLVFQIARLTYTVTKLNEGGMTSITFVPYLSLSPDTALWTEGGVAMNNRTGNFTGGSGYTISDPALIPAPTLPTEAFGVPINSPTILYELSNAQSIDPLDPASVKITSQPVHGTATIQGDGTILYTPATGFAAGDSLQFTVADSVTRVTSQPVEVKLSVNNATAPVATDFAVSTFANDPVGISPSAHVTSSVQVNRGLVTIVQPSLHGTLEVDSSGFITYSPNENFVGADSFTYRVIDYDGDSSNAATVALTVQQSTQPTAIDDSFNVNQNQPTSLNVLANDVAGSLGLSGNVQLISDPNNGTAMVQPNGTVLYTPSMGYSGWDSFTYLTTDTLGNPSNIATVTITVGDIPPTANNFTDAVLTGQTNTINLLSHATITGGAAIAPQQSSVKVLTAPSNGTATVNVDGTVSYLPTPGFVGADSFTYAVADEAGGISQPGTVTLDVGVELSDAKGQNHRLSFTDAAGGVETISLNHGTAGIFFSNTSSLTVKKNGVTTLSGTGLNITHFALGNTNRGSVLSIVGSIATPVALGQISDDSPLGSIVAPSVNVTGDITLNSAASITVGNISNSTITIGDSPPGTFSLTTAIVSGSSLDSGMPINAIKAESWIGSNPIIAPAINSLVTKTGGLAATISTGALGVLRVGGSLTGNISAASAKSIAIAGQIDGASINITGLGRLGQLIAGSVTDASVTAARIQSVSLGDITTNNGGTDFGIHADSIGSFTGIFGTTPLHLGRAQLKSTAALAAYLNRRGIDLGDFEIVFGSARVN